ncbi:hypothetical protein POTOM_037277 [Populus tomentosa]|uniref:Probable histone-arginine methyltransferase CARM1-like N-terminal PH domain-containing protein n=1 Tax=Populus tomentosa TaxID=118781 RepID=A0A8X7YX24_POPTO|nr:hypothetical protein POTOM_037277 [Populus tomentosa]
MIVVIFSSCVPYSLATILKITVRFSADNGVAGLRFNRDSESTDSISVDVRTAQLFKLGPLQSVCIAEASGAGTGKEKYSTGVTVQFRNEEESRAFHCAFEQWKKKDTVQDVRFQFLKLDKPHKSRCSLVYCMCSKCKKSMMDMSFESDGQCDNVNKINVSGTYYAAVIENRADFLGRVVVDVGAGSGILSLFAAQAGAKHVYAVEASEMAEYARKLIAGNPSLGERITVIKGKVEEVELPEKADILISEPMGTLLVNERMLESYVIARDRFLVPNGKMFPTVGSDDTIQSTLLTISSPYTMSVYSSPCKVRLRIHMAPFSDEYLFVEIANKALFWQQQNYYGVDLTPLYGSAFGGYFSQPVVDAFDPRLLVAPTICHVLDFTEIKGGALLSAVHLKQVLLPKLLDLRSLFMSDSCSFLHDEVTALTILGSTHQNFSTFLLQEEDLYEIVIPLKFIASVGTRVHGLACWMISLLHVFHPTNLLASYGNHLDLQYCTKVAYNCPWCAYHPLVPITLCSVSATLCDGRARNYWPAPDGCPQCSELHSIFNFVRLVFASHFCLSDLFSSFSNKLGSTLTAKMWGPGAEQGGILQTSSCKLDLKEPYYRMSQPQAYAMAQDQQPHQPIHTQDIHIQAAEDLEEPELIQPPPQNLDGQLQLEIEGWLWIRWIEMVVRQRLAMADGETGNQRQRHKAVVRLFLALRSLIQY